MQTIQLTTDHTEWMRKSSTNTVKNNMTLTWTSGLNSYFPKEDVQLLKHTGKMHDDISHQTNANHIIFVMSSCYQ